MARGAQCAPLTEQPFCLPHRVENFYVIPPVGAVATSSKNGISE